MPVAAFTWSDLAYLALAVFLFAVGLGLGYAFFALAGTLNRVSSLIQGTERELLPVLEKVGGSVDRVNGQLDKVDQMTDSAVDATESLDGAVRAASFAVTTPVQKVTGFTAGISHGIAALKARRGWRDAVRTGRQAAARREHDLAEELARTREERP